MLVISTQNWSILTKGAMKNPAKSAVFYWLFLGQDSPQNFPWNWPILLRIFPWKSFEIWLFSAKIPWNQPIFLLILTFLPRNRPIFPWILSFFPRKSREIGQIFRELAPENPAKFCFFFAKYQKPCIVVTVQRLKNGKDQHWVSVLERCPSYRTACQEWFDCNHTKTLFPLVT